MPDQNDLIFENPLRIPAGQMTTPHWHPNSCETLVAVEGKCEVFVLKPSLVTDVLGTSPLERLNFVSLVKLSADPEGDEKNATSVPRGKMHYVVGDPTEGVLLDTIFDNPAPEVVFLSQAIGGAIETETPVNALQATYEGTLGLAAIRDLNVPRDLMVNA